MKVYVYYAEDSGMTTCHLNELTRLGGCRLIQVIECEETVLPITENWECDGIAIGEIFRCNDMTENLIRIS